MRQHSAGSIITPVICWTSHQGVPIIELPPSATWPQLAASLPMGLLRPRRELQGQQIESADLRHLCFSVPSATSARPCRRQMNYGLQHRPCRLMRSLTIRPVPTSAFSDRYLLSCWKSVRKDFRCKVQMPASLAPPYGESYAFQRFCIGQRLQIRTSSGVTSHKSLCSPCWPWRSTSYRRSERRAYPYLNHPL